MKFTNARALIKHLAEAAPQHFSPVYMVSAGDDGERKEAVQSTISALLGQQKSFEHALKTIDGERASASEIMEDLEANNLFASTRIVHLCQADKLKEAATTRLEKYFANPNPKVFLVISTPSMNRGSRFYKQIEKVGVILDIEEQKPWEKAAAMLQYALQKFAQEGVKADQQVCKQLVERAGSQQLLLQQEIDKLCCYLGERRQVTEADVEAISIKTSTQNGWQLGESIFRRDAVASFRMMHSLLEQEGSLIALARQLRSQFQVKCQICAILASGRGPEEVQKQFPYMRGTILQQNIQAAQSYGLDRLKKGLMAIDEIELLAKSSSAAEELLAEQLVFKLTK